MRAVRLLPILFPATFVGAPLAVALVADNVPTDVQLPGTQPGEVPELESPNKCDNCHGGYDADVEPTHNWRGSMMAQSVRDPLFWATVAIAEQDFAGSGDLCIRCHSPEGWLGGRSTPTDGSGLKESDASGVMCDLCHALTDPTGLELAGVQLEPFVANDGGDPPEGFYGSAMYVMASSGQKLGPYDDPASPHQSLQSSFHRRSELCGTCHDVSNPVVGDLAHNHGAQAPLAPGTYSGVPGDAVENKAAFNNPPYAYGTVERTFSEHRASLLYGTRVADYASLPAELQDGAIEAAWLAATAAVPSGDYADGTPRYFTCQTCHMPPVQGKGCNKASAPVRDDLPHHDLTGGSTWMPEVIQYLDGQGKLLFGGGLDAGMQLALDAGVVRARAMLQSAASLEVNGNSVRVTNLTGHKLISGFPEGRRMWLNVEWYDGEGALLREDGAYGALDVVLDGSPQQVDTLLDLHDPNTTVYEAHFGVTQEWAGQLLALGYDPLLPIAFDRITGDVVTTLGDVGALAPGEHVETFHFVLNNVLTKDNRIPPYGMSRDEAERRSILPVPADLYGDPGPGGVYEHWDDVELSPPAGAATASIELLYQSTSWEYVQFLHLSNDGSETFLASTGTDLLDAWLNTGMAPPEVMASATWSAPFPDCNGNGVDDAQDLAAGTSLDLDGDGGPDECQPFSADAAGVSIAAGGSVQFALDAGAEHAGSLYWILGSVTGTSPGIPLDGELLPLVPDGYFGLTLSVPGAGIFDGALAFLDGDGEAAAAIQLVPGALTPGLAGTVLHHAYLVADVAGSGAVVFASNPIPTALGS